MKYGPLHKETLIYNFQIAIYALVYNVDISRKAGFFYDFQLWRFLLVFLFIFHFIIVF
jgi:hypothetical protein